MTFVLSITACALYAAAWLLLVRQLMHTSQAGAANLPGASAVLGGLGVLGHASLLYTQVGDLRLGVLDAASLTLWVANVAVLAIAWRRPIGTLALFLWPLSIAFIVQAGIIGADRAAMRAAPALEPGVQIHAVTSLLAYSVLTLAALQAGLLYVQERRLRDRRPGRMTRVLPPLQTQEKVLVQMVGTGFFLLSLSLASGFVFVQDLFAQHLVHKSVLSCIGWGVFAVVLFGRWRYGWRGRTLVRWTLAGVAVLLLAYFGAKLVLEVILGRSWSRP